MSTWCIPSQWRSTDVGVYRGVGGGGADEQLFRLLQGPPAPSVLSEEFDKDGLDLTLEYSTSSLKIYHCESSPVQGQG